MNRALNASNRELRIQQAITDYQRRTHPSIRAAAAANDIHHSTLVRRLQGHQSPSLSHESQQLLSNQQEALLKSWIIDLEAQGHAPSYRAVRDLAGIISESNGGPRRVGLNWLPRFLERHPDVKSKVGQKICAKRVNCTLPELLEPWFNDLKVVKVRYSIRPENSYNMDEAGTALGVCSNQLVIGTSATTRALRKTPETREWTTIVETVSAIGQRLQPLVIFKGQALRTTWFDQDSPAYRYTISNNGWTSNEIGLAWLDLIFIPQTATEDTARGAYRLLLMDGHKSHVTYEFMWKCFQNNIVVYYLLPHSSHVLQPLDLACFSPVKSRYRDALADLARFDDAAPIKKTKFLQIYQKASQEGLTTANIKAGWKASGIYPWNPRLPIRSSQVLANKEKAQYTVHTPPSRKRKALDSDVYNTPINRRVYSESLVLATRRETLSRPMRNWLKKTGQVIERLEWDTRQKDEQITKLQNSLDEEKTRGQKGKAIDVNEMFASIESIHLAKEALELSAATTTTRRRPRQVTNARNDTSNDPQEAFMSQFYINDLVG